MELGLKPPYLFLWGQLVQLIECHGNFVLGILLALRHYVLLTARFSNIYIFRGWWWSCPKRLERGAAQATTQPRTALDDLPLLLPPHRPPAAEIPGVSMNPLGFAGIGATSLLCAGLLLHRRQAAAPRILLQTAFPQRHVHPEEWRYHFERDIRQVFDPHYRPGFRRWARMQRDKIACPKSYQHDGRALTSGDELRALIGAEEVFKLALERVAATRPDKRVTSSLPDDRRDVRDEVERLTQLFAGLGLIELL
jgi:hypothetical protein